MKIIIFTILIAVSLTVNANSTGWQIQNSPTTQNLHGVSFIDLNTWVAVGDAGTILRSIDGGANWSIISSTIVDGLYAVAMRGNYGMAVGISGRMARTTDGGLSWIEQTRQTTRNLYSVSIGDFSTVITGHEGTILVSTNSGVNWTAHTAGTASILFGVSVNGNTAVGVGGQGAVVMSVNGGNGWGLTILGGQLTFFYSTSFVNSMTGWAVGSSSTTGSVIIRSSDAGFVWSGQTSPTTEQLFGVSFTTIDSGTAVGTNGTIIHTVNGGTSWVIQNSGTAQILNAVSFINSNTGIAVGNAGTILKTTDGGNVSNVHNISYSVPDNYSLKQNYPNPFNPTTNIRFEIPKDGFVKLEVLNMIGQEVGALVNEKLHAGTFEVKFNASQYPSGVYFYRLNANGFSETKKMILIK